MEYSQKYCVVCFLDVQPEGSEFRMQSWPLHVTLVGTFAIDEIQRIYKALEIIANETAVIKLNSLDDTIFGTTKVTLVERSPELYELHSKIVEVLIKNEASINSPDHQLEGFRPHCTVQKNERIESGQVIKLTGLSIIDMFPSGDWQQRKVLKNLTFNH